jgi:hypothetical protein
MIGCAGYSNPLAQWTSIGSHVSAWIVNESDHDVNVSMQAPKLENSQRQLGIVSAHDSSLFAVPFADTKVQIVIDGKVMYTFSPVKPGTWRFVVRQ